MIQATIQHSAQAASIKPLPSYVVPAMCWIFAILFGIWALPHTVFIRHTSMVLGAALGLYVIGYLWKNGLLKIQVNAIPIFLILTLFVWVTIHLVWIGKEPALQWLEFARAWKKIFITFPFALGLGLGIRYVIQSGDEKQSQRLWRIMYFALLLPTIIFYIKFGLTEWAKAAQFALSPYLVLSQDWSHSSGMPKYFYVFFSLPAFAIAIGTITHAVLKNTLRLKTHAIYFVVILTVPIIFYLQSVRNGIVYAGILIIITLIMLGFSVLIRGSRKQKTIFGILVIFLLVLAAASLKANPAWKMLVADTKVALQFNKIDNWKYQGQLGIPYPINEHGVAVNASNYDRATWLFAGIQLLPENPLGYGLMTLSFDHLTKAKWPNSFMSQTHSAWLDFTLGYGVPGVTLFAAALFLAWRNSKLIKEPWCYVGRWGLGVLGLIMFTTEISSEIFIGALIFMVVMIAGLTMSLQTDHSPHTNPKQ